MPRERRGEQSLERGARGEPSRSSFSDPYYGEADRFFGLDNETEKKSSHHGSPYDGAWGKDSSPHGSPYDGAWGKDSSHHGSPYDGAWGKESSHHGSPYDGARGKSSSHKSSESVPRREREALEAEEAHRAEYESYLHPEKKHRSKGKSGGKSHNKSTKTQGNKEETAVKKGKPRKKKKFFLVRVYHFCLMMLLLTLGGFLAWTLLVPAPSLPESSTLTTPDGTEQLLSGGRKAGVYNLLLVGSDNGDYNADTIMVAQFNGNTGEVNLISVPRDTLVYRTWSNFPKINAAFSRGIEQLQTEVSYTLGIPIDFYVQVGLDAFVAVVDAMGGLEFHVPQDMYHDDEGGFIIDLQEGWQTLDGRHALELVRYRGYATADIGRTETQQQVLKALAQQMLTVNTLLNWESYWAVFQEYVETDLSKNDMLWFSKTLLANFKSFSLYTQTLEGKGNGIYNGYTWCYELDQAKTLEVVNLYLNPFTEERTLEDLCLLSASGYS